MLFMDVMVQIDIHVYMFILSKPAVGEISVKPRKPPKAKQRGDAPKAKQKGGASLKVSIGRKQLSDSHCSQQVSAMTIQVPRSKLRGSLGHSCQQPSHNPLLLDYSVVYGEIPLNSCGGGTTTMSSSHGKMNAHDCQHQIAGFALGERADQVVPNEGYHKSNYEEANKCE